MQPLAGAELDQCKIYTISEVEQTFLLQYKLCLSGRGLCNQVAGTVQVTHAGAPLTRHSARSVCVWRNAGNAKTLYWNTELNTGLFLVILPTDQSCIARA